MHFDLGKTFDGLKSLTFMKNVIQTMVEFKLKMLTSLFPELAVNHLNSFVLSPLSHNLFS